jgi:hypothetical protein
VDDERIDTALGALRRDADRLLAPLATELRRVRDAIDAALDVLPTR